MVGEPAVPLPDTGFEVVKRGYDQAQVEDHLRRLDAHVRILVHDREAAADQSDQLARELDEARARTERLRAQVRTLVSPPQSVQGMSERMRSMLRLAEDEVTEMRGRSEEEANRHVREAQQQAAQIVDAARAEADDTRAVLLADTEGAVQEHARERDVIAEERRAAVAEAVAAATQAEQDRARAWAESESRRAMVEEDFTIAMDQRRSEAISALTVERLEARDAIEEQRERAAAAARATVEDAQAQYRRIVGDAERRIVELTALRRRIVEQLGGTKAVLERSIGALDPLPEELGEPGGSTASPAPPLGGEAERSVGSAVHDDVPAVGVDDIEDQTGPPARTPAERDAFNGGGADWAPSSRRRDFRTRVESLPMMAQSPDWSRR